MATANMRKIGEQFCEKHPNQELNFLCEDCDSPVCDICISTLHQNHTLTSVNIVAQAKFNYIQDFNNKCKGERIPKTKQNIQDARNFTEEMEKKIDTDIQETETHRRFLKDRIDSLANKTVSYLKKLKDKCIKTFAKFKLNSDASIKRLEDLMKENNQTLKTTNNKIMAIDTAKMLASTNLDSPEFEKVSPYKLTFGTNVDDLLNKAFGLFTEISNKSKQMIQKTSQIWNQDEIGNMSFPTEAKTLILSFMPRSIAVAKNGTIWMCKATSFGGYFSAQSLYSIDINNSLNHKEMDINITNIALDPSNDDLYCLSDNTVVIVDRMTYKATYLFSVEDKPWSIAITKDNRILVGDGYNPSIKVYRKNGEHIKTFTYKGKFPVHISLCNHTGMIAICCNDSNILVLDSNFTEIYTYTGPPGVQGKFRDAIFDCYRHLIVADISGKVHIINAATGKHVQTFTATGFHTGRCLAMQLNGDVLVGTHEPNKLFAFKF